MTAARKPATLIGIIIFLGSMPFLLWSAWPAQASRQVLEVSADHFALGSLQETGSGTTPDPAGYPTGTGLRQISLETPTGLRVGEKGPIRLAISTNSADPGEDSPPLVGYTIEAQARLELAGVSANPPGMISQPLLPGKPAVFTWQVQSGRAGSFAGRVWLFLRFLPTNGDPATERAVSVQEFILKENQLLGLGEAPARVLGGAGAVGGVGLILFGMIQARGAIKTHRKLG